MKDSIQKLTDLALNDNRGLNVIVSVYGVARCITVLICDNNDKVLLQGTVFLNNANPDQALRDMLTEALTVVNNHVMGKVA